METKMLDWITRKKEAIFAPVGLEGFKVKLEPPHFDVEKAKIYCGQINTANKGLYPAETGQHKVDVSVAKEKTKGLWLAALFPHASTEIFRPYLLQRKPKICVGFLNGNGGTYRCVGFGMNCICFSQGHSNCLSARVQLRVHNSRLLHINDLKGPPLPIMPERVRQRLKEAEGIMGGEPVVVFETKDWKRVARDPIAGLIVDDTFYAVAYWDLTEKEAELVNRLSAPKL